MTGAPEWRIQFDNSAKSVRWAGAHTLACNVNALRLWRGACIACVHWSSAFVKSGLTRLKPVASMQVGQPLDGLDLISRPA